MSAHSRAAIVGCQGLELSEDEKNAFRDYQPFGFILFARNVETTDQVKKLCDDLREAVGWYAPILIDQEGGRVARLRPPLVPESLPFERFGQIYQSDPEKAFRAIALNTQMQASYLLDMGINVNCSPVMDLRIQGAHDIIGDRSFGEDPYMVYAIAKQVCETFLAYGVTPISKHLPGHGRALSDSHLELPKLSTDIAVLELSDFLPFRELYSDAFFQKTVWGMVAHIVYEEIDTENPATTSKKVVDTLLRNKITGDAFLVADDIGMEALTGTPTERALATLSSGLDATLVCNNPFEEVVAILKETPILTDDAWRRFKTGETIRKSAENKALEPFVLEKELKALIQ